MNGNLNIEGALFEELGRAPKTSDLERVVRALGFEGDVSVKWAVETQATFGEGSWSDISGYLGSSIGENGAYVSISIPQIEAECRQSGENPAAVALESFAFALSDLVAPDSDLSPEVASALEVAGNTDPRPGLVLDLEVVNSEELELMNVSMDEFRSWIRAAMTCDCLFTITFVNSEEMRRMNGEYRGKNYATNVLTFDYPDDEIVAADIALCREVLQKEADEQGKTIKEHLAHLTIHGVLHAHGYDHIEEAEAEEMESRETELMLGLGFAEPYSDPTKVHD